MYSGRAVANSIAIAATLLVGLRLSAQTAGLSGLVFDPSKLAVPNARLFVENAETSATRSVLSNPEGVYNVSALPPGRYSITIQAKGFKTIQQSDVILEVAQHARALPNPTNSAGRSPTPMKLLIRLLALFSVETAGTMRAWGSIAL